MADLGPGVRRTGDIATAPGLNVCCIGPTRSKLIKKGMIYSPAAGDITFSVPIFDAFIKRAMLDFQPSQPSRAWRESLLAACSSSVMTGMRRISLSSGRSSQDRQPPKFVCIGKHRGDSRRNPLTKAT